MPLLHKYRIFYPHPFREYAVYIKNINPTAIMRYHTPSLGMNLGGVFAIWI